MIVLLSPAKIQDFKSEPTLFKSTQPIFMDEAESLVNRIRRLSISALADLLKINPSLARLNADRYAQWKRPFTIKNAKQAVMVFNGEVFHGLDVRNIAQEHFAYLQNHLRIFSGMYGILRPFDLIQPYRLDIGDAFLTEDHENLYSFWKQKLTDTLNQELVKRKEPPIVLNLASGEYMKGIDLKKLNARVINVDFLQMEPRGYKTIVVYTKKARGMMTRFVVENRIQDPELLKGFDSEGYMYNSILSKENKMVFTR
ncbi:MAG TPA: peroxide stress protein YaaA [Bacteroidales bacterium]|nr:peroxide stress protein YaaA [Bacteroidales bacterium]